MLDGRFHLNFSHLGIILKFLSTISFSDSADELDKGHLFLFSRLDLDFFLISLLERFPFFVLDEGEFPFPWLVSFILLTC